MSSREPPDPSRESPTAKPAQAREALDPDERKRPLPWFVVMLIGAMAAWGISYIQGMHAGLDSRYGDSRTTSALEPARAPSGASSGASNGVPIDGGQIFATKCAACHQANGAGVPGVFPPLATSEWVMGSEKVLVQIPLHGIIGKLEVKGTTYNGAMPTFGALSDEEIAAVLTHIRSQWGNTAAPVSPLTVRAGRDASKARTTPWSSGDEIKQGAAL